ncbi:SAM5A-like protein [Mya arenaria]|uniref:SAM5A-like protein n=1 Tax=Mya arenaria TaxID=6604 RepID=A0ABY7DZ99_MYAAR|nr:SAM5A-like protein [Mya arenaria]
MTFPFQFASLLGMHNVRWDGVWRDLRCLSNTSAFAVREQAGHSLKSSIIVCTNMIYNQYAIGEYSNIALCLFTQVLQLTVAGGVVRSLEENGKILINDRFFLGGPLTLRGFNKNGVGPHSDGNALGGDVYCMSGLHLYTPLPFRPGKGGFGNIFRSHFFVNTGTCGNVQNLSIDQLNRGNLDSFKNTLRMSYGFGIVLRLGGIARVELNYVIPAWQQKGDRWTDCGKD